MHMCMLVLVSYVILLFILFPFYSTFVKLSSQKEKRHNLSIFLNHMKIELDAKNLC